MKCLIVIAAIVAVALTGKFKEGEQSAPSLEELAKRQLFPHANSSCAPNQFRCDGWFGYHQCIPEVFVCDTDRDCYDGSDERQNCSRDCSGEHQFSCGPNARCISIDRRCDGNYDCHDKRDEINCDKVDCGPGKIQCDNFHCIKETYLCDGDNDCGDHWDELNCTSSCSSSQFKCHDGSRCIPRAHMCDRNQDCYDFSDEANCACQSNQFKCNNGMCVFDDMKCDGSDDCGDSSDEVGCNIHSSLCDDMMTMRDCAIMNATDFPICQRPEDGFKFCRKFCGLCVIHNN